MQAKTKVNVGVTMIVVAIFAALGHYLGIFKASFELSETPMFAWGIDMIVLGIGTYLLSSGIQDKSSG